MLKKRVLLAEDDETSQVLMNTILNNLNIHCDIACDGIQAIDMYNANDYNIVFIDIRMPEKDGIDVIQEISSVSKGKIPIIVVSSVATIEMKIKALSVGAVDYIVKPITFCIIQERVSNWI